MRNCDFQCFVRMGVEGRLNNNLLVLNKNKLYVYESRNSKRHSMVVDLRYISLKKIGEHRDLSSFDFDYLK